MNKQELVKRIARDAEVTQRQAAVMIDSMVNIIMDTVADGEKVLIQGFGCFESRTRAARNSRNPATGDIMVIPEAVVPVFKAGQEFKDKLD